MSVQGTVYIVRTHSFAHHMLDADDLRREHPLLRPRDSDVAIYEDPAGLLLPERCVEAHAHTAEAAGAELRYAEPVLDWNADGTGVSVTTSSEKYSAERLVI